MLKRAGIIVLVSLFLAACGETSTSTPSPTNPVPTPPTTGGPTPDDIGVTFGEANFEDGYLSYDVNIVNNADVKVDAIRITINLLEGNTVVDDGTAGVVTGLDAGQQRNGGAAFFDTESLDEFECYEYNLQIIVTDGSIVADKDYPGTCE